MDKLGPFVNRLSPSVAALEIEYFAELQVLLYEAELSHGDTGFVPSAIENPLTDISLQFWPF